MGAHLVSKWRFVAGLLATMSLGLAGCTEAPAPAPVNAAEPPVLVAQTPSARVKEQSAESAGFAFPTDLAGKHLEERLTPPRQVPALPVPFTQTPLPWRWAKLDSAAERSRLLPPTETPSGPRILPEERRSTAKRRPTLDVSLLTSETDPARPTVPFLPAGLLVSAPSPDPVVAPPLAPIARLIPDVPTVSSDPTGDGSRRAAMTILSVLRDQPAPFLRLTIPNPFENAQAVRVRTPIPDADEPAASSSRPPLPPFPVK